jgi:hypothetical protein
MQVAVAFASPLLGTLLPKVGIMAAGMALNHVFGPNKDKNEGRLQAGVRIGTLAT